MQSTADISVVIPAYNAGRFVGEAIESVLAQELQAREIIVVDDGSEDDTAEVVQRYPMVRYHHQENGGQASARNTGLALATCSYVAFHDADDLMKPYRLRDQFDYLIAHPDVDMVGGRQEIEVMEGTDPPDWLDLVDPVFGDPGGIALDGSLLARAESLKRIGGFDETLVHVGQLSLLARLRENGLSFAILDGIVVTRRIHGENLSRDVGELVQETARALHGHLKRSRRSER